MARRRAVKTRRPDHPFRKRLVFMAKAPVLGTVKSRLAKDVGWVKATAFHRHSVRNLTLRLSRNSRWDSVLALAPDSTLKSAFPSSQGLIRIAQGAGDLGARMHRVMVDLPPGPVIIIGTDIPQISQREIADAFRLLGRRSAVLGPGKDGGYWLVGLRRTPAIPAIFRNVRWSSAHTLDDTLANTGPDTAFADTLEDVDDVTSYRSLETAAMRVVHPPWWRPEI